jgi:hypothetical protein
LSKDITCRQALAELEGIIREMGECALASRICPVQKAKRALYLVKLSRAYIEKFGEGKGALPKGGRGMKPVKSTEKDLGL